MRFLSMSIAHTTSIILAGSVPRMLFLCRLCSLPAMTTVMYDCQRRGHLSMPVREITFYEQIIKHVLCSTEIMFNLPAKAFSLPPFF